MNLQLATRHHPDGRFAVVSMTGPIDVRGVPSLRDHLRQTAKTCSCRIVLDLSCVSAVDFAGLAAISVLTQQFHKDGGWLRVVAPRVEALQLVHAARLARRVQVFGSVREALRGADDRVRERASVRERPSVREHASALS